MCCRNSHGDLLPPTQVSPGVFKCPGMPHPDACPKGNYCPNSTTKRNCKDGHFCPEGSVEPLKCPVCDILFRKSFIVIIIIIVNYNDDNNNHIHD